MNINRISYLQANGQLMLAFLSTLDEYCPAVEQAQAHSIIYISRASIVVATQRTEKNFFFSLLASATLSTPNLVFSWKI